MAYRNLIIENNAQIHIQNEQLLIQTDTKHSVPLEDINSILFENRQTTITVAVLAKLTQMGSTVFVCDEKHTPCGVMLPFAQHCRCSSMFKLQENLTIPWQKQMWQQIVKAKIINQSKCLALLDKHTSATYLFNLSKKVTSGDKTNIEAVAANYYFRHLFATKICRNNDNDIRNNFLNYGYAIIRGHLARLIANYGLLPMKGIHHHNELNAYNLADDFIEPFRAVVDLYTAQRENLTALNPADKRALYNLLNVDMELQNKKFTLAYVAEKMVQSFTSCCQNKSKELLLPSLIKLRQHTYE